jgi:hypothetical protein
MKTLARVALVATSFVAATSLGSPAAAAGLVERYKRRHDNPLWRALWLGPPAPPARREP